MPSLRAFTLLHLRSLPRTFGRVPFAFANLSADALLSDRTYFPRYDTVVFYAPLCPLSKGAMQSDLGCFWMLPYQSEYPGKELSSASRLFFALTVWSRSCIGYLPSLWRIYCHNGQTMFGVLSKGHHNDVEQN